MKRMTRSGHNVRGNRIGTAGAIALIVGSQTISVTTRAQESQSAPGAKEELQLEEITVTASRVSREGFSAPTPTTILGAIEIRQSAATNIGAVLNEMPAFMASWSPTTSTTTTRSGLSAANLHGLGDVRTLTLIDGRRPVATTSGDGFNLNSIPFGIVERVEVVTGGASAAWGSGAVAGVVNLIFDTDFDGIKADASYGESSRGDGEEYRAGLTFGTPFADGRGHLLLAAEHADSGDIRPMTSRDNVGGWNLLPNSAYAPGNGEPQGIIAANARFTNFSEGGVILGGPLGGTGFGPGGVPEAYDYGSNVGASYMIGGDGGSWDDYIALQAPVKRKNAFARGSFELTQNVTAIGQVLYAESSSSSDFFPELSAPTISRDNAFLPQSIRDQMTTLGEDSFTLGRLHADWGSGHNYVSFESVQAMAGLEGSFGDGWSWDAYYAYGQTTHFNSFSNQSIKSRLAQSIDSVIDPVTGEAVCRSGASGCVPIDLFGPNAASAAALSYFLGEAWIDNDLQQHVGAFSLQGEPFSTWAGPVSVAFGGEWREESVQAKIDPLSLVKGFSTLNYGPIAGAFNVKEGFVETVVPLAAGLPLLHALDFNGAVRVSDYSTSGSITSWKTGVNYQPVEDLRLRATQSRDMRAPNLSELFTVSRTGLATVIDPATNTQYRIATFSRGNPDLEPEKSDTFTLGFSYQPSWLSGFTASVDYFDVEINGVITTISATEIVERCFAGSAPLCGLISRDAGGAITSVDVPNLNLNAAETKGLDIELGYRLRVLSGDLSLRVLATYVDELILDDGVTREDNAGQVGLFIDGIPHWRGTASAALAFERLTVDLRARYVGGGKFDENVTIDRNDVASRTYVDFGVQYDLSSASDSEVTIFGNVRNLLDREPPVLPNPSIYDVIGRYFTVGVRAKY